MLYNIDPVVSKLEGLTLGETFLLLSVYGITQLFSTKESPLTNGKKNNMIYGGVF